MRISKGYWLWGLFPFRQKVILNEIKSKVQSKLKSPFFETHITLAGPFLKIDNTFLSKLKNFLENNSVIALNVGGYGFKQEVFRSFYISWNNTINIKVYYLT